MSNPTAYIGSEESLKRLQKCKADCAELFEVGNVERWSGMVVGAVDLVTFGLVEDNNAAGKAAAAQVKCNNKCDTDHAPRSSTSLSAEDSLKLDALAEKAARSNSVAQAQAAQKVSACAREYLDNQKQLAAAYETFENDLLTADFGFDVINRWVGSAANGRIGTADWQVQSSNYTVGQHKTMARYMAYIRDTGKNGVVEKGESSEQMKLLASANVGGGPRLNLDPIVIDKPVFTKLHDMGVDDHYTYGSAKVANMSDSQKAVWAGWPFFWASWVGALGKQVHVILDSPLTESDLLALSSDAKVEGTNQSGYHSVTEKITGDHHSENTDGGAYGITQENTQHGSPAGILAHGAPRYWPGGYAGRSGIRSQTLASGETSKREGIMHGLPDAQYSLVAWAGETKTVMATLRAQSAPASDSNVDKMIKAIEKFAGAVGTYAAKLNEAAGCIYEADRFADNAINDNIQKVLDEAEELGIEGALDWLANRDRSGDASGAGSDAAGNLRAAANSGKLLYEGTPEKLFFKEQCFLLSFVGILADYKKYYLDHGDQAAGSNAPLLTAVSPEGNHKRLPYHPVVDAAPIGLSAVTNASLLLDGDPYGFLNKLIMSPFAKRLNDIENWELSNIQPKIRLFKVIYDENGGEKEVEISFDSHFSNQDMDFFKTKESRGAGVGLKYFNFTYDGSNPFAAKKSIKAKLEIFANTFQELLRPRRGKAVELKEDPSGTNTHLGRGKSEEYKYVELALKTAKPQQSTECKPNQDYLDMIETNEEMAKLNFRLKAVVGLSAPSGLNGMRASDAEAIQAALNDSFVTLNLTPTIHDFDFDEMGRVKFTINYLAYVEDFFNQKGFNIFADPSGKVSYNAIVRNLQMKTYQRDCGSTATDDNDAVGADADAETPPTPQQHLAAIKEKFAKQIEEDQLSSVAQLLDSMACSNTIYYINVPYEKVKQFLHVGPFANYASYVKQYKQGNFIRNDASQSQLIAQRVNEAMQSLHTTRNRERDANDIAIADQTKNQIATAIAMVHPQDNNLAYFYASDLLDIVLANIQQDLDELPKLLAQGLPGGTSPIDHTTACDIKNQIQKTNLYKTNFKRFRLLLGPVEIVHQKPHESVMSTFVNFGDIPISVKYFTEWLTTKVLQRDENHYPLSKFLNDFFNNLIRSFLNNDSCFAYNIAQKVRLNQTVITSYTGLSDPTEDEITHAIFSKLGPKASRINMSAFKMPKTCDSSTGARTDVIRPEDSELPILNISGPRGSFNTYAPLSTEMNYFVFFAGRTMPTEEQKGLRCADEDRGIQHYLLGRDKGLIKNIKLSKAEAKGLAEVRFEQDGYDGLRQLRNVYDVQIDSFASVQTFPGTYIYVSPSGFDPSVAVDSDGFDLTDMGIGGYCMVTRSEHEFGEGYANSTIHAKWVAAVDAQNPDNEHNGKSESIQGAGGKCGIYAYRQKAHKGGGA